MEETEEEDTEAEEEEEEEGEEEEEKEEEEVFLRPHFIQRLADCVSRSPLAPTSCALCRAHTFLRALLRAARARVPVKIQHRRP